MCVNLDDTIHVCECISFVCVCGCMGEKMRMGVGACVRVLHTYMYTCMNTRSRIHTRLCTHRQTCIYIHIQHTNTHTHIHVFVPT